jgi:hypothetical protein
MFKKFINVSLVLLNTLLFLPVLIVLGLWFVMWFTLALLYKIISGETIKDFWYETHGEEIENMLREFKDILFSKD